MNAEMAVNFNAAAHKLKRQLGVRGRLIVFALVLVAPLMLDRVRLLESNRAEQIKAASQELTEIARRGAEAQSTLISTVDGFLKTATFIYAAAEKQGTACGILRSGIALRFEWLKNLSVIGPDGVAKCSTLPQLVGVDVNDRPYFQKAVATRELVVSDYVTGKAFDEPMILAALATPSADPSKSSVIVASVNLKWLNQLMGNIGKNGNLKVMMLDGKGTVIAARGGDEDKVGQLFPSAKLRDTVLSRQSGTYSATNDEGSKRLISFVRVPSSDARLIVSSDEALILAAIDRDILAAYLQFAVIGLLVLLGAWWVSERLIIRPIKGITAMAQRFGQGDLGARATRDDLPAEFRPLASAFNVMAAQLSARDAELRANNNRLTVLASVDVVSGVANRRGFESRLEFEWMKAEQTGEKLALVMIDVDHFKLFNDTYGHLQGDTCLRTIGATLAELANEFGGFPARYGGEEFLLLLPNCDAATAMAFAERVRLTVQDLAIPHISSSYGALTVSLGVVASQPGAGGDPSDLVAAADAGLYAAKRRGRNTVVEHGEIHVVDDQAIAV
jgi:diguanylate cyclase (GGDEF)-like protein